MGFISCLVCRQLTNWDTRLAVHSMMQNNTAVTTTTGSLGCCALSTVCKLDTNNIGRQENNKWLEMKKLTKTKQRSIMRAPSLTTFWSSAWIFTDQLNFNSKAIKSNNNKNKQERKRKKTISQIHRVKCTSTHTEKLSQIITLPQFQFVY